MLNLSINHIKIITIFSLPGCGAEIGAAHGAGVRPVGAALASDVSAVALEDGAVAGDGEADGTLHDLPQLPP